MTVGFVNRRQIGGILAGAVLAGRAAAVHGNVVKPVRVSSRVTAASPSVYYDRLEPPAPRSTIIMVHGGAHSGACYLHTADMRSGWAHYFAERGYRVLVPDWPGCGRSGTVPLTQLDGELVCAGLAGLISEIEEKVVLLVHSMSGAFGWKLIELFGEKIIKAVAVAPAPPGNIQPLAEVVGRGEGYLLVRQAAGIVRLSESEPLIPSDVFIERKLIGSGSQFPIESIQSYKSSLLAVPPRLVLERANVDGSQLRVQDTANFRSRPILMVVGTHDLDHPVDLDRQTFEWLEAQGARGAFVPLSDRHIVGNGHMMMLERNSDCIADLVLDWIAAS